MSKFFITTIYLLGILLVVFSAMSYVPPFYSRVKKTFSQNSPQTTLYFKPNIIRSTCLNSTITSTIYLDSNQNLINGAQIELQYDPQILHNLNIKPAQNNFFGKDYTVLIQEVREEYGRATLAIEENPGRTEKKGNSAVASISFEATSLTATSTATTISFLNKNAATNTTTESSLLKEAFPLTIQCAKNMYMPSTQPSSNSANVSK